MWMGRTLANEIYVVFAKREDYVRLFNLEEEPLGPQDMILYVNQTTELPLLTLSLQRKRRKIDLSKFKGKKSTLRPTFTCSTQIPWFVLFFLQINTLKFLLKFLLLQLSTFKFLSISLCYLSKCKKFPNFPCRSINERNCLIRKMCYRRRGRGSGSVGVPMVTTHNREVSPVC